MGVLIYLSQVSCLGAFQESIVAITLHNQSRGVASISLERLCHDKSIDETRASIQLDSGERSNHGRTKLLSASCLGEAYRGACSENDKSLAIVFCRSTIAEVVGVKSTTVGLHNHLVTSAFVVLGRVGNPFKVTKVHNVAQVSASCEPTSEAEAVRRLQSLGVAPVSVLVPNGGACAGEHVHPPQQQYRVCSQQGRHSPW